MQLYRQRNAELAHLNMILDLVSPILLAAETELQQLRVVLIRKTHDLTWTSRRGQKTMICNFNKFLFHGLLLTMRSNGGQDLWYFIA